MSTSAAIQPGRRYRGSTPDERRAQRRERLLRAAVHVYGKVGYRQATVRAVCKAAGLTERYFYESFENSEALLVAAYQAVNRVLLSGIKQAAAAAPPGDRVQRTRAILAAYYGALQRDPRSARVFLIEVAGVSPAVDGVLEKALDKFAALIAETLDPAGSASLARQPLMRTAVIGGVLHLAITWVKSDCAAPVDEVVVAALKTSLSLLGGSHRD
ncbi:MAG TPA: TetR/AcrR family transcriptional regulator [bacterium]